MLFAGSSIISGKAEGVVTAVGKSTAFGELAVSAQNTQKQSSYEKSIIYFCKLVLRIVLITIALLFVANLFLKGMSNVSGFLLFCVALIISILPEALPAVVTFALAKGSLKMAKDHVVVRRLSAIEDMGNIEILCADKTGTLTENKMSLEKIVSKPCILMGC